MRVKRFFCQLCNKVKRVQTLPLGTSNIYNGDPTVRVGTCRWHHASSRAVAQDRVKRRHINVKRRKSAPVQAQPKKDKRQGKSLGLQEARRNSAA